MTFRGWVLAVAVLGLHTAALGDIVVMDQIGPNGTFTNGQTLVHSQFVASSASLADAAVDDFTLSAATVITRVQAAMSVFGSGASKAAYTSVTSWAVQIYSSPSAASTSIVGDVASVSVAPGSVSLAAPFTSAARSALITVPMNLRLGIGTYWLAVVASSPSFSQGQIGVYLSTYSGTPSNNNSFLANPGGGGGFANNRLQINEDLGYRVNGLLATPEPGGFLLTGVALFAAVLLRRRTASSSAA